MRVCGLSPAPVCVEWLLSSVALKMDTNNLTALLLDTPELDRINTKIQERVSVSTYLAICAWRPRRAVTCNYLRYSLEQCIVLKGQLDMVPTCAFGRADAVCRTSVIMS